MTCNEIITTKSYLTMYDEAEWGTVPGSPTYIHVPVLDYDVRMRTQQRRAIPFTGLLQRVHSRHSKGLPTGTMRVPLYGWRPSGLSTSLAEYLMTWAFNSPETICSDSKGIEWAEGPNTANKRHVGMRVNAATLRGSEDEEICQLILQLAGKDESGDDVVTTAQTLPDNRNKAIEFEFADALFTLDGTSESVKAFQINAQYGLAVEYLNSRRPTLLVKRMCQQTLSIVLPKDSDTWDALRRSNTISDLEMSCTIVLKGTHNSTGASGTYAVGTISLPRLSFVDAEETRDQHQLAFQPLEFDILKPDTSAAALSIVWSEA
jgi:hypothetical protein